MITLKTTKWELAEELYSKWEHTYIDLGKRLTKRELLISIIRVEMLRGFMVFLEFKCMNEKSMHYTMYILKVM